MEIYALNNSGQRDNSKKITLQVNPSTISTNYKIEYNKKDSIGSTGSDCKFVRSDPGSLSFKVMFDGTGVIDSTSPDVTTQINNLLDLCYCYKGDQHEPNKLAIVWGEILFKSCLNSVNITYKLFSPEGKPLRAELDLQFSQYMTKKEEEKTKDNQSPDITHVFQIYKGDNLPGLCKKVYKNAKMYMEIARVNNLTDFRNLIPGKKINLPPLK